VRKIVSYGNFLISGDSKGNVQIRDMGNGAQIVNQFTVNQSVEAIQVIDISQKTFIFVGDNGGMITVVHVDNNVPIQASFRSNNNVKSQGGVRHMQIIGDSMLTLGGSDAMIRLWKLN